MKLAALFALVCATAFGQASSIPAAPGAGSLPPSANGVATNSGGAAQAQTSANVINEFSCAAPGAQNALYSDGTCKTLIYTGITTTNPGSPVFFNFGSASAGGKSPGAGQSGGATVCGTTMFWLSAGWIRNSAVSTDTVNPNANTRSNIDPDCFGTAAWPGGAIVPPNAAAGGFVDASPNPYGHLEQGAMLGAYMTKQQLNGTAPVHNVITAEFVSDDNATDTVLAGSLNVTPGSSATTYYSGDIGGESTTELLSAFPMPVPGTIQAIDFCYSGQPANTGQSWTLNKNGSATPATVGVLTTDAAVGCKTDLAHPVTVAAGDYIDYADVNTASTVAAPTNYGALFVPTNGTSSIWGSALTNTTFNTTNYVPFGAYQGQTATQQNATTTLPYNCNGTNLYAILATAEPAASTVTLAIQYAPPGSSVFTTSVVTGTIAASTVAGAQALYTGAPATWLKGGQLTLKATITGSTSGQFGGVSFSCN